MLNSKQIGTNLCVREASGAWRPAIGDEVISAARAALARRVRKGAVLSSPRDVQDYLKMKLAGLDHEVFCAIFLDTRHKLIEYRELFRGTILDITSFRLIG